MGSSADDDHDNFAKKREFLRKRLRQKYTKIGKYKIFDKIDTFMIFQQKLSLSKVSLSAILKGESEILRNISISNL